MTEYSLMGRQWGHTGRPCRPSKYSKHFCSVIFSRAICFWVISWTKQDILDKYITSKAENTVSLESKTQIYNATVSAGLRGVPNLKCYIFCCLACFGGLSCLTFMSPPCLTFMLSGRPSARRFSLSLLSSTSRVSSREGPWLSSGSPCRPLLYLQVSACSSIFCTLICSTDCFSLRSKEGKCHTTKSPQSPLKIKLLVVYISWTEFR